MARKTYRKIKSSRGQRKCDVCGATFIYVNRKRKFCSDRCASRYYMSKWRAKKKKDENYLISLRNNDMDKQYVDEQIQKLKRNLTSKFGVKLIKNKLESSRNLRDEIKKIEEEPTISEEDLKKMIRKEIRKVLNEYPHVARMMKRVNQSEQVGAHKKESPSS